MENYTLPNSNTLDSQAANALARAYLNKVYAWMAATMLVTAGTALYALQSAEVLTWVVSNIWLLILGSIAVIIVMCLAARRLTAGALGILLMVFAVAEGLLFGPILCHYTQESLGLTFACTAGMFGAMSLFGAMTKINMSSWGRGLFMGLIGLIIAGIANAFWGNGMTELIISAAGVILFSILTAYDTQKLLQEGLYGTEEERSKGAILGALSLYLDFINLFLYLLRFLGRDE
ncbi:MAG: Bax inhibitor-1/YccA family protein [Akkermansiaceae bacterium]|nr:Bax inhibitor-1/YccA family protein [Akkermansiaceae bacterium]